MVDLGRGRRGEPARAPPERTERAGAGRRSTQLAVLHAPDDVGLVDRGLRRRGLGAGPSGCRTRSSPTRPARPAWSRWSARTPADLADFLERELARAAGAGRRAARRSSASTANRPPVQRRLVVAVHRLRAGLRVGPLRRCCGRCCEAAGPQLGLTLIFLVERELDEPGRVDLRIRLPGDGPLGIEGRPSLVTERRSTTACPTASASGLAELIARRLAPLRLSDEQRTGAGPDRVVDRDAARRRPADRRHHRPAGQEPHQRAAAAGADRHRRRGRARSCWTSRSRRRAATARTA